MAKPNLQGSPFFSPVKCIKPVQAWMRLSKAGKFFFQPISPNPETEQQTNLLLYFFKVQQSIPSFSVTPGTKFQMTASESAAKRQSTSLHFCSFKLRVMLFLFLLIDMKYADYFSTQGGPHILLASPSGGSTLRTLHPKSESTIVAQGPAIILDRSNIFFPEIKGI